MKSTLLMLCCTACNQDAKQIIYAYPGELKNIVDRFVKDCDVAPASNIWIGEEDVRGIAEYLEIKDTIGYVYLYMRDCSTDIPPFSYGHSQLYMTSVGDQKVYYDVKVNHAITLHDSLKWEEVDDLDHRIVEGELIRRNYPEKVYLYNRITKEIVYESGYESEDKD